MPYPEVIHFVQSVLSLFSHLPTVPFYQTFISRTHAVRTAHGLNVSPVVSRAGYHSVLHFAVRTQYEAADRRCARQRSAVICPASLGTNTLLVSNVTHVWTPTSNENVQESICMALSTEKREV